jgi:hypothetical protein
MLRDSAFACLLLLLALAVGPAQAQSDTQTGKQFNLQHAREDTVAMSDQEAEVETWEPGIEPGALEMSLTLGFLDLNQTLLSADQVIYKFTDKQIYWGDVSLIGQSAFNPEVRLSYNLSHWLAIEPLFSISVSEYNGQIINRHSRENTNDPNARVLDDPELGEYDAEHRSAITLGTGADLQIYPFNLLRGNGKGRLHPFLLGGVSRVWFDLNSNYTAKAAAAWNYMAGVGLRLIADDLVSVRIHALYQQAKVQFPVADVFDEVEGFAPAPVYQYPNGEPPPVVLQEFASRTISGISWGVGFTANF